MTREFKVGDEVFSTSHGIGKIIDVMKDISYPIVSNINHRTTFTPEGKRFRDDKYPSLFHLDEALQLFPQWLEEVEEESVEIYWTIYQKSNHCLPVCEPFSDKESCETHIKDFHMRSGIPVEIHISTKRKIIRERK